MNTYVLVKSEYFELDTSKHRLGMTGVTCAPSLQHQTDKEFTLVLDVCPMDPRWTNRMEMFYSVGVPIMQKHDYAAEDGFKRRIEIEMGDDDFLAPEFVELAKSQSQRKENINYTTPNGYLWHQGFGYDMRSDKGVVRVTHVNNPFRKDAESCEMTAERLWVHVRHRANLTVLDERLLKAKRASIPNWKAWKQGILEQYCKMEMKTGTAVGAQVFPSQRKIVFAKGTRSRR